MKHTFLAVILILAAGAAHAQAGRGQIGNAGRLPETMSPGFQPPTSMPSPTPIAPTSRYPGTQSLSQDRIESQGYHVQNIQPQNDGSFSAGASRDAVPTRPQGVPSRITIFPDGHMVEERE
jgi:hypothetical protein